jgi:protein TonB
VAAVSESAPQQDRLETSFADGLGAPGLRASETLVALTHDRSLRDTLTAVAPQHSLSFVDTEAELTTLLLSQPAGVAILDSTAVGTPLAHLTERLRAQFPDLVLIVAGSALEQASLSHQIAAGTIYRFLHKPVSAQRVRLFVDAAWRRHDVEHAATGSYAALKLESSSGLSAVPRGLLWAGLALVVVAIAGGLWLALQPSGVPATVRAGAEPAAVKPAARQIDAGLSDLLARADAALASGKLSAPPGDNAADLYRQALQRDANNARAQKGLDQVVDGLLNSAEQELLAGRTDEAERLTALARAIQPRHVRIAFLNASIAKEREREALAKKAENVARASDEAASHKAQRDLDKRLLAEAHAAAQAGNLDEAQRWTRAARDAGATDEEMASAQRQLESAQASAKSDAIARTSQLFNQRMTEGRLIDPPGDSAKFYLGQMVSTDAGDPSTAAARDALAARLAAEARDATARGDFAAAARWVTEARSVGVAAGEADALERALAAAREQADRPEIVAESRLERVHNVAPVYPAQADRLGRGGSVELEFTVRTDGTVADIKITHAQPPGVFDKAVVDAVRNWRYRPVQRDGHPVDQRARLRVVFAPH